ncbi:hypothetical protein INS49_004475 [Diaporthe citri]|uniref:uncharacterized protein n=1 Tax=Diaporthe citri TaxID=83186 RepID=UPI001C7EE960|nr:uncharacterized protein INS49_004475 [Diaporthe citri]KAG6354458.1 hypothetical protein INS49_004475 [Diaporthe citri]
MPSTTSLLFLLLICLVLASPVAAFGAGEVPPGSEFKGYVWRHGDLAEVLKFLPTSFITGYRFTKLQRKQIYFGNWLRDFSQVIDTTCLENVPEPILRAIVSVMAFMEFGFATDEFDVTRERLGCYTHVEHIDNPCGYPEDAKKIDARLRGPVDPRELEIDPETGMKNYIANSGNGWDTSADYLRGQLLECVELGRKGRAQHETEARKDAFRRLGAALHTLEDFSAHSNFIELCLHELGEDGIFPFVGDACRITIPDGARAGKVVAPLTTGTFGMLDIFHSLLGEADDKAVLQSKGSLGELASKLNRGGLAFDRLFQLIKTGIGRLSQIQPDIDPLLRQLQTVQEIFKKHTPDDKELPTPSDLPDANLLWKTIEPVIYLHDAVSKYLQAGQEDEEESTQDYSHGQLGEYTNQLVFRYLAVMIESSVMELRNAVKAARDRVDEEAAKCDSAKVFKDGSSASDPSHSDLSKDHFSNVLNQPGGLVATVTTNWTTQQIVKCWDDPDIDAELVIDKVLSILHHPSFPDNKTPIQQYMFDTVKAWWDTTPSDEKDRIRGKLTKGSVRERQHEDHNLTLRDFENKHKGPADFPGAWPEVKQPPRKASLIQAGVNDAIADFNWALAVTQKARTDPRGAGRDVWNAHASPAPHWASDVHTAVEVPHLPHELHTDVPLTSAWHALNPVAELGLHPLKVFAAAGVLKLYDCRSTPQTLFGAAEGLGTTEEVERLLVGRSLDVGERVMVDWLEDGVLEGRVLEVERMSDDRLDTVDERPEIVEERLGIVDERLGTVEDRLGIVDDEIGTDEDELTTTDDVRELASLEDDSAGVVVLTAESDGEDTTLEACDELGTMELSGADELAAALDELEATELGLATDGRAEEADDDAVLERMDETMELMLDSSALFVTVLTGTNDELTLSTEVMTDDEAGVVAVDDRWGVVLVVVGLLVVVEVVLATKPLLVDVTVAPLTVTVVGRVTLAVDTVTAVLPVTVVVTVGAVQTDEKHEQAADTAGMARPTRAAEAKTAKSSRARSSSMARSSNSWTCSLR